MGLFNINKITKAVQSAAETATKAAGDAAQTAAKAVQDSKLPDQVTNLFQQSDESEAPRPCPPGTLSPHDSASVYYYLMSADGELADSEMERFHSICDDAGIDDEHRESLTAICNDHMMAHASVISPLVTTMACVDDVLASPSDLNRDETPISSRLLIWNMIAIAHSDESFDDIERELINHVADKLDVGRALVLEMEQSITALTDLEREEQWVKTTNRPYMVIEGIVAEIEHRKEVVFEGVQTLITL